MARKIVLILSIQLLLIFVNKEIFLIFQLFKVITKEAYQWLNIKTLIK